MSNELTEEEIEQQSREWGDYDDLAAPFFFRRMISTYRAAAKQARKRGDNLKALDYYNRMLSLSRHWHNVYGSRTSAIEGGEVDLANAYLKRFKKITGTLYDSTYARDGAIEGDVLLSATDYKNLRDLTALVFGQV